MAAEIVMVRSAQLLLCGALAVCLVASHRYDLVAVAVAVACVLLEVASRWRMRRERAEALRALQGVVVVIDRLEICANCDSKAPLFANGCHGCAEELLMPHLHVACRTCAYRWMVRP